MALPKESVTGVPALATPDRLARIEEFLMQTNASIWVRYLEKANMASHPARTLDKFTFKLNRHVNEIAYYLLLCAAVLAQAAVVNVHSKTYGLVAATMCLLMLTRPVTWLSYRFDAVNLVSVSGIIQTAVKLVRIDAPIYEKHGWADLFGVPIPGSLIALLMGTVVINPHMFNIHIFPEIPAVSAVISLGAYVLLVNERIGLDSTVLVNRLQVLLIMMTQVFTVYEWSVFVNDVNDTTTIPRHVATAINTIMSCVTMAVMSSNRRPVPLRQTKDLWYIAVAMFTSNLYGAFDAVRVDLGLGGCAYWFAAHHVLYGMYRVWAELTERSGTFQDMEPTRLNAQNFICAALLTTQAWSLGHNIDCVHTIVNGPEDYSTFDWSFRNVLGRSSLALLHSAPMWVGAYVFRRVLAKDFSSTLHAIVNGGDVHVANLSTSLLVYATTSIVTLSRLPMLLESPFANLPGWLLVVSLNTLTNELRNTSYMDVFGLYSSTSMRWVTSVYTLSCIYSFTYNMTCITMSPPDTMALIGTATAFLGSLLLLDKYDLTKMPVRTVHIPFAGVLLAYTLVQTIRHGTVLCEHDGDASAHNTPQQETKLMDRRKGMAWFGAVSLCVFVGRHLVLLARQEP